MTRLTLKQWTNVKCDICDRLTGYHFLVVVFTFQSSRTNKKIYETFSTLVSGWVGWWVAGKVCLGCISVTIRCMKLILGRNIGWGCRCATSWCDLDLIFDFAEVTLSLKIFYGLYFGNCKV